MYLINKKESECMAANKVEEKLKRKSMEAFSEDVTLEIVQNSKKTSGKKWCKYAKQW